MACKGSLVQIQSGPPFFASLQSATNGAAIQQVKKKDAQRSFSEVGQNKVYDVYLLKLANKEYYCGYSENIRIRLKEHAEGKCNATKNLKPIGLVWCCSFINKYRALAFEKYLKSSSGKAFRNKHLI